MACVHVLLWGNNSSCYENIPEVAESPANFKPHSSSQVGEKAKEKLLLPEQHRSETHLQQRLGRHSRIHGQTVRSNHSITGWSVL